LLADFEPAAAAAAARAFSSVSFSSLLCGRNKGAQRSSPGDDGTSHHLQFGGGTEYAVANSIENVGRRRGRSEKLGQEVVASRFQDDLIVDVGYVHHLHKM
jgi:hypothetical protein